MEMNISSLIKYYRQLEKLSQSELAKRTGITQQSISRWENGERLPNIIDLVKLAEFFGVTVDELIGRIN